jgi:hypothetical protein
MWSAYLTWDEGQSTVADQGINLVPEASHLQVLVDWLEAIRFDGRTLPREAAQKTNSATVKGHLTTEEFNSIIAQNACRLVPVAVVEHSIPGTFTAAASSIACSYPEGSGETGVTIGYGLRTSSSVQQINAQMAGGSQVAVGDYGMVFVNRQEHGVVLEFVDQRFFVQIEAAIPGVSSAQVTALARAVEAILSR